MKRTFYLVFFNFFIVVSLFSQRYDNNWIYGYCNECDNSEMRLWGNATVHFTKGFIGTIYEKRGVEFDLAAMYLSDPTTGELLLYSNGCAIYDAENKLLMDTLNPGETFDSWCPEQGYSYAKNGCFLPDANNPNLFHLLHIGDEYIDMYGWVTTTLAYTSIEYKNSEWMFIKKRQKLLNKWLFRNSFEVTKHSNGKYWWVLNYNFDSDSCIRFLLTENGFEGPYYQNIPIPRGEFDWGASSSFSPDGRVLIRVDLRTGLSIMDFDRSTGLLSNMRYLPIWIDPKEIDNVQVMNSSISPNSRFLYVSTPFELWQFDLTANDIFSSFTRIDSFDSFASIFGTTFFRHQLAPDGKIYMNCTNGDNYLHIIHNPDEKGKACNFKQHDFKLPIYNSLTLPYFPNYRLGKISNSDDVGQVSTISVFPNPAGSHLFISNKVDNEKLIIFNQYGELMLSTSDVVIDLIKFEPGVYYIMQESKNRNILATKFIKM